MNTLDFLSWHLLFAKYRLEINKRYHIYNPLLVGYHYFWFSSWQWHLKQENREYFMESAGVRYLRTGCWRIRNRTSERSERVRFLIQKQRVRKYRTKHFPCGIVFIVNILRHSSFWWPFYFKSFKNAKICRYTLTAKWKRKQCISFLVKMFVKNINDSKDMR